MAFYKLRLSKKKWVHFISHWLAWVQKVATEAEWMERSQKYNNKRCLVRHPWEIRRHFLLEWQLSLKPFRGSAKFSPWWLTSSMRNAALLWACLDLIQRLKTVKLENSFHFRNGFGNWLVIVFDINVKKTRYNVLHLIAKATTFSFLLDFQPLLPLCLDGARAAPSLWSCLLWFM